MLQGASEVEDFAEEEEGLGQKVSGYALLLLVRLGGTVW